MAQKTFTEKIIDILINGDMPTDKGQKATETGLIILTSKMTAPVCASYGSGLDMAETLSQILEMSEPIRVVITAAVVNYAVAHPDDPCISGIKYCIE